MLDITNKNMKTENEQESNLSIVISSPENKEISFNEEDSNDLAVERSTSTNTLNVFHIDKQSAKSNSATSLNVPSSRSMTSILSFPFPTQGNGILFLYATFLIFLAIFCFLAGLMTGKYTLCQCSSETVNMENGYQ
jgi:hypothetical protein